MQSKNQIVSDCRIAVSYQAKIVQELEAQAKADQATAWQGRGGCERCGGRGWIVVWDTMDSMSGCYAEYGACPEEMCTEETRKLTGRDPSYYSKYDGIQGVRDPFVPPAATAERALLQELRDILEEAESEARVEKNKTVRVVKGRKVAIGTEGVCFWIGSAGGNGRGISYGDRIGFKDSAGTTHWTSLSNVEVV